MAEMQGGNNLQEFIENLSKPRVIAPGQIKDGNEVMQIYN